MFNFMNKIHENVMTYGVTAVAFFSNVDWMMVGGAVLLTCKLIQEAPKAYKALKDIYNGKYSSN